MDITAAGSWLFRVGNAIVGPTTEALDWFLPSTPGSPGEWTLYWLIGAFLGGIAAAVFWHNERQGMGSLGVGLFVGATWGLIPLLTGVAVLLVGYAAPLVLLGAVVFGVSRLLLTGVLHIRRIH